MLDLNGKVALVFGCGAVADGWGNGRATSVLLARQGAQVFGTDLVLDHAQNTLECLRQEGLNACVMACDATDSNQVQEAVNQCLQKHGRIDILVNNVGLSMRGGPEDMDEDIWNAQLQVNMTSAFLGCKYVIPHMRQQGGGAIVNVSSVAGLRYIGKPQVAYAAAKAGLMQFTRTSAVIHGKDGIRLNCVVPGLMNTPLIEGLASKYAAGDTEGFIAQRHNQVPIGHMGSGWDTAHAVLFLVADESRYITGTEIVVDGGLVAATR
ncbi:SDR family oxidoreductase [Lampropedia puyangensis]|uniref:SDR family oxidoreductase n=1 Tax=Lampropedia puyangensis TaxID=1330072 RepID=A0A4S8FCM0_9BURK|nr:SDR family oxidoreductase [Lampropedia puyangensis]THU05290.1 SDR family oxidoreductase [Lampropedia puyangensis]